MADRAPRTVHVVHQTVDRWAGTLTRHVVGLRTVFLTIVGYLFARPIVGRALAIEDDRVFVEAMEPLAVLLSVLLLLYPASKVASGVRDWGAGRAAEGAAEAAKASANFTDAVDAPPGADPEPDQGDDHV